MSHLIGYKTYNADTGPKQILRDLNSFAYDPQETSGYHGNLTFHPDIICKDKEEATEKIRNLIKNSYDDHAVYFKDGDKQYWLVKYEYHC